MSNISDLQTSTEWKNEWGLILPDEDECGTWHFENLEEAKQAANHNVLCLWTIVQADDRGRDLEIIRPGNALVNRTHQWLVSKKERPKDLPYKPYLWWDYDNDTDDWVPDHKCKQGE